MNDSMMKFQELMKEAMQCVDNLNKETKNMVSAKNAERQKQLDTFIADLKEFTEYIRPLDNYVRVKLPGHNNFYISLKFNKDPGLYTGTEYFNGWIDKSAKSYQSYHWTNLMGTYYSLSSTEMEDAHKLLDELLDAWDKDLFAERLIKECEIVMTDIAQKANAQYENAKNDLQKAKENKA